MNHDQGVVYNEMKGVLSDSNNLFGTKLQQELLQGTIYGNVSGGDPAAIPTLTYAELQAFHAKHYHPSNALFYSYGDLPLTSHLQYIDEVVLSRFDYRADSAATRVDAAPFSIHQTEEEKDKAKVLFVDGPSDGMGGSGNNEGTKFCVSKLLPVTSVDRFETFVLRVVGYLLTNGPSSPLYKALIESGLATDFSVGTGFDTSTFYASFGVGVEGVKQDNVAQVEHAIQQAYASVLDQGFDAQRVEALLHQVRHSAMDWVALVRC